MAKNVNALLKKVLLFSELPDDMLGHLGEKVLQKTLSAGDLLFKEGDSGDVLYMIASGEFEIFRGDAEDEHRQVLAKLGEGESLGEMALLEDKPRTASARALVESSLLLLSRKDFKDLLEQNGQLALKLTAVISARLRNQEQATSPDAHHALNLSKTHVFISYSRHDKAFVQKLHKGIESAGASTWVDWENIPLTADWWREIERGITDTDAFVFVISPDSLRSDVCQKEINAAVSKNKRIMPVLYRDAPADAAIPVAVAAANWVSMHDDAEFSANLPAMLEAINTDLDWVREHTRLLNRALEWDASKRDRNLLLRGRDLENAQAWLAKAGAVQQPKPLPIHGEYIQASRRDAIQRSRLTRAAGLAFIAVLLVATIISSLGFRDATLAKNDAYDARATAVISANIAATAQVDAENSLSQSKRLLLSIEAQSVLADPLGNAETAALLSLRALDGNYLEQADTALMRSVTRLHTVGVLRGHEDTVYDVEFSPDGSKLLTADGDGTARIWDVFTKAELLELKGHAGNVNSASFSPDGKYVITAGDDGTARLWDAQSGFEIKQFVGHTGAVNAAIFSANGKWVLTGGEDSTAILWEVETGNLLHIFEGHKAAINSVDFSPDGSYVLTGSADKTARVWSLQTGLVVRIFSGHTRDVLCAVYSNDGNYVITSSDTTIRMFDVFLEEEVRQFVGHADRVRSVEFSPDGKYIISGSSDGTARLWNAATGEEVARLTGHIDSIRSVAYAGDGVQVATGSVDTTVRIWDTSTDTRKRYFSGYGDTVYSAIFSPDGRYVLTGGGDKNAHLWDAHTFSPIRLFKGHENWVSNAAFSPDGKYILTASWDGTAILWDAETGSKIIVYMGHTDSIYDAEFSPDGKQVLTASEDGTARVWDTLTAEELLKIDGHDGEPVLSAVYSPDGKYILTASNDETARTWNAKTGAAVQVFAGHGDQVKDAVFSPDGKLILTASDDGTARLWDAATGETLFEYKGHLNQVKVVAFSPDGKYALTGSDDSTARLWDVESGALVRVLGAHVAPVKSVAFSPDGNYILTSSVDGSALMWDVDFRETIKTACSWVFRDLTLDEIARFNLDPDVATCP